MLYLSNLLLISLISTSSSYDYCNRDCNKDGTWYHNSACRYDCKPVNHHYEMLQYEKDEFRRVMVEVHNLVRNRIATGNRSFVKFGPKGTPEHIEDLNPKMPKAANLRAISYDEELEYMAECHVSMGKYEHDKCNGVRRLGLVGQNIHLDKYHSMEPPRPKITLSEDHDSVCYAVFAWWGELEVFEPVVLSSYHRSKAPHGKWGQWGHFTQSIWATTSRVGCAHVINHDENSHMLTCNYWPTGNLVGRAVLEEGEPNCQKHYKMAHNDKYPGLCGEIEPIPKYDKNKKFGIEEDICEPGEIPMEGDHHITHDDAAALTTGLNLILLTITADVFNYFST